MKCREVQPDMSFNEVLALEGLAEMPERGLRDEYYLWLVQSGINIEWLIGAGDDVVHPFSDDVAGTSLRDAVLTRAQRRANVEV